MIRYNFDSEWRFALGDINRWSETNYSEWRVLNLPHDWSIEGKFDANAPAGASVGFLPTGKGTYIKEFYVDHGWAGKRVYVEFEGVYMNAEVWINGNYLGRHPYGYTSFILDITEYLKFDLPNVLKVFVDNGYQPNSRWYSGSGIYRHVWLRVAEPVHISHWGVFVTTTEASCDYARLSIMTSVTDNEKILTSTGPGLLLRYCVLNPKGDIAAQSEAAVSTASEMVVEHTLEIRNPALWSPDSPSLYTLTVELVEPDRILDSETITFGIRTLHVTQEDGLLLNGTPIKLKGGCVHHDNGILGAASYDRAEERKVRLLKKSGFNAVRCAHNPPAPSFLDACDRLGLMVIDEAFDCWREGKNPGDYHIVFDEWWTRDLSGIVMRDRNHPSVIMWSIGNELMERDGRSKAALTARRLADLVRAFDSTRPVTAALQNVDNGWAKTDNVFAELDVCGYNYNHSQYRLDHERVPYRIIFGSESFPREALQNWLEVSTLSYVIGDFVWTSFDYLGEAGIGRVHNDGPNASFLGEYPWNQAHCGDIDICGHKRPQSYYRDMVWRTGKDVYIAVHKPGTEDSKLSMTPWAWPDVVASWTWSDCIGRTFVIDVYSNCDEVELFLNGKSLGRKKTGIAELLTASFEASYEPGRLTAIGYKEGLRAAEYSLSTAGVPTSIRLSPDTEKLSAARGELSYIDVEVIDDAGNLVPAADNPLSFNVQGPGKLVAVGSADPKSEESYRGTRRRAYEGRCLAVIEAVGTTGDIVLTATSDGLADSSIRIKVV